MSNRVKWIDCAGDRYCVRGRDEREREREREKIHSEGEIGFLSRVLVIALPQVCVIAEYVYSSDGWKFSGYVFVG